MIKEMRPADRYTFGFLKFIEECIKPNSVMLEIGAFAGESTKMLLDSGKIEKLYVIDAWQNGLDTFDPTITCDLGEVEKIFDATVEPYGDKVVKIKSNSLEYFDKFNDGFFDIIYHDSCHEYLHVKTEVQLYLPKIKEGGIVSGHDYGSPFEGVKRAVDELIVIPDKTYDDYTWVKFL